MSAVAEGVMSIIAARLGPDRPVQVSDWLDELGLASLDVVELIFELEERFGVDIPVNANTAGKEFKTVGDVVLLVEKLVATKDGT